MGGRDQSERLVAINRNCRSRSPGVRNYTRRVSKRLGLGGFKTEFKAKVQEILPAMFETLNVKPFIPMFELELVAHGDGAFFARHRDPDKNQFRIISVVYYFHALPKIFSGGLLRLHSLAGSGRDGTFIDISPDYDTLLFFPSMFPHEVLPVELPSGGFLNSRFAINCWLHRTTAALRLSESEATQFKRQSRALRRDVSKSMLDTPSRKTESLYVEARRP
jgi:Rps23 Pro-64 3,4-dihydroxylase Tpa1-like proline 4-hydroxylase